jgi:hypothetical protein
MDPAAQTEVIISFLGSHDAIMAERLLLDSGIDVRVMPMPPALGPACGIALRLAAADLAKARPLLGVTVAGLYCRAPDGEFVPWKP